MPVYAVPAPLSVPSARRDRAIYRNYFARLHTAVPGSALSGNLPDCYGLSDSVRGMAWPVCHAGIPGASLHFPVRAKRTNHLSAVPASPSPLLLVFPVQFKGLEPSPRFCLVGLRAAPLVFVQGREGA
jgi:hypothetical protein